MPARLSARHPRASWYDGTFLCYRSMADPQRTQRRWSRIPCAARNVLRAPCAVDRVAGTVVLHGTHRTFLAAPESPRSAITDGFTRAGMNPSEPADGDREPREHREEIGPVATEQRKQAFVAPFATRRPRSGRPPPGHGQAKRERFGAGGGIRTHTPLRAMDFESIMSAIPSLRPAAIVCHTVSTDRTRLTVDRRLGTPPGLIASHTRVASHQ